FRRHRAVHFDDTTRVANSRIDLHRIVVEAERECSEAPLDEVLAGRIVGQVETNEHMSAVPGVGEYERVGRDADLVTQELIYGASSSEGALMLGVRCRSSRRADRITVDQQP